jgi:hypothetical protein
MFIEWYGQICQMFVPKEIMEYLKILPKLKTKNINYIEYRILKYICEYPNSTSYDIEAKLGLPRRRITQVERTKYVHLYHIIGMLHGKPFVSLIHLPIRCNY